MIARLVESHYFRNLDAPTDEQIRFWFRELRTAELLTKLAKRYSATTLTTTAARPLLAHATAGDLPALEAALHNEEQREKDADRAYWLPLKTQLEQLRHARQ